MNRSPRHDLDQAIDRVAAKMVAAPDGDDFVHQVLAELPEREASRWFHAWPARLAVGAALVLVAFVYARPAREAGPGEAPRLAVAATVPAVPVAEPAPLPPAMPTAVPAGAHRSLIPDPRSPIPDPRFPIPDPRSDHERSLAPVDPIAALELAGIATPSIDLESPAAIEPLVLTELALDIEGDS
ncbi:MAG: hypothetical protein AB7P34_15565 [Vicinamibacterales bacterium]